MKRKLASFFFGFVTFGSTFAAPAITAEDFMNSLYADRTKVNAVSYYDVMRGGQYHLYFTVSSDTASYKTWNSVRIQKELAPLLDVVACSSTRKARPGNDMDWTEFRRTGGTLVVHLGHLSDPKFNVQAQLPPKTSGCS